MATVNTVLNGVPIRVTFRVDFDSFESISPSNPVHVTLVEDLVAAALRGDLQAAIKIQQKMRPLRTAPEGD